MGEDFSDYEIVSEKIPKIKNAPKFRGVFDFNSGE
jgi:hypothetical protein